MRLLGRNASAVGGRNDGGLYSDVDYQRLPRNPVFYPPTPKDCDTDVFADSSLDISDQTRARRLVSRIKTIFSAKGPPTSSPKQRSAGHHIADTNDTVLPHNAHHAKPDQRTPQRPKLVARSPLREACISPDFLAFADIDCLHINITSSGDGKQNTTNAAAKKLKRRNFTTSVCLPSFTSTNYSASAGQGCSLSPASTTAASFIRGSLSPFPEMAESQRTKHGVARSASCMSSRKVIPPMLVPSLSTLPQMQCQPSPELPEENHQRHRDSRGSETTAVLVEIESTGNHLCDLEQPSLSPPKQSKTSSPSQKTLSEACTSSEEFISNAFAASMLTEYPQLDMAFDKELDVFHTFSNSRRPYSEGFPEKSPSVETSKPSALSGNRNISRIVVPVINSQWAMYARSSYAESGLVKSTFDLAKMLPSAPQ